MKKIIVISIILGVFYYLLVFSAYAMPIKFAIEPIYMVPASYISGFLRNSPKFIQVSLIIIGLGLFFYSIYLLVGFIQKRLQNWWKTFYFTLITTFALAYAFIYIIDFGGGSPRIYINYPIISVFLFSTILLFPLREFRHLIISYAVYIISYIALLEVFVKSLLLYGYFGIAIYFAPFYILLLYLLTFQFIIGTKIYPYLILVLLLIPLRIKNKARFRKYHITPQKTVEYTMIVPADNFYEVKEFKRPLSYFFSYSMILEPDSIYYYEKNLFGGISFPFSYFRLNLNEKRVNSVKNLLNNRKIFIGEKLRERIGEKILKRWEEKRERGIIKGRIEGDLPDRIGILSPKKNIKFIWNIAFCSSNLRDAVSPDKQGNFEFNYVPKGTYKILFLYKKKVPHYNIKMPLVYSKNDTINLGLIKILGVSH